MSQYGWQDCPSDVRAQVEGLVGALKVLGDNLVGVYLHGSLAMGCFNPERSDIDILVVTKLGMAAETIRQVAELLSHHSATPRPIEISFLNEENLYPWKYPTPFDFHFSEELRGAYEQKLLMDTWENRDEGKGDPDVAAHIVILLNRGICLYGKPIKEVFPSVSQEHYIDSIMRDLDWARQRSDLNPVYFVLNACRVCAYLREGKIFSKDEGGAWATDVFPEEFQEIITQALEVYRGTRDERLDQVALGKFAAYIEQQMHSPKD